MENQFLKNLLDSRTWWLMPATTHKMEGGGPVWVQDQPALYSKTLPQKCFREKKNLPQKVMLMSPRIAVIFSTSQYKGCGYISWQHVCVAYRNP